MNAIFTVVFIFSAVILAFVSPDLVLSAMTKGSEKAVTLSIGLISIYSIWSGLLKVAEDSGIINKLNKLLSPIINRLFKNADDETKKYVALNVGANMLGIGGVATPSGIKATTLLCDKGNFDGACLLFVLASTSLQIIPTTIVSLRQNFGSNSSFDIFLPSLITTVLSTSVGVFACFLFKKRGNKK